MREVTWIGSACLGELIRLHAACASVELRHTQPQLERLLEVTGFAEIFEDGAVVRTGDLPHSDGVLDAQLPIGVPRIGHSA